MQRRHVVIPKWTNSMAPSWQRILLPCPWCTHAMACSVQAPARHGEVHSVLRMCIRYPQSHCELQARCLWPSGSVFSKVCCVKLQCRTPLGLCTTVGICLSPPRPVLTPHKLLGSNRQRVFSSPRPSTFTRPLNHMARFWAHHCLPVCKAAIASIARLLFLQCAALTMCSASFPTSFCSLFPWVARKSFILDLASCKCCLKRKLKGTPRKVKQRATKSSAVAKTNLGTSNIFREWSQPDIQDLLTA